MTIIFTEYFKSSYSFEAFSINKPVNFQSQSDGKNIS